MKCAPALASCFGRELSKPRLCQRLGVFQPAPSHQLEAARTTIRRYSPVAAIAPQGLWKEYEQSLDQARLQRQRAWSSYRDTASRERGQLKRTLAAQRRAIQKTPHPGTWRDFVASHAAHRDARAIRLLRRPERERGRCNEEREL
jgi:hypothetical protein